jgi:tetrahydromethanopterin S-methyltransferase subunit F
VRHTINAVKQFLKGEDVKLIKPLGAGAILGIIIGIIFLLILLSIPVTYLFGF